MKRRRFPFTLSAGGQVYVRRPVLAEDFSLLLLRGRNAIRIIRGQARLLH